MLVWIDIADMTCEGAAKKVQRQVWQREVRQRSAVSRSSPALAAVQGSRDSEHGTNELLQVGEALAAGGRGGDAARLQALLARLQGGLPEADALTSLLLRLQVLLRAQHCCWVLLWHMCCIPCPSPCAMSVSRAKRMQHSLACTDANFQQFFVPKRPKNTVEGLPPSVALQGLHMGEAVVVYTTQLPYN